MKDILNAIEETEIMLDATRTALGRIPDIASIGAAATLDAVRRQQEERQRMSNDLHKRRDKIFGTLCDAYYMLKGPAGVARLMMFMVGDHTFSFENAGNAWTVQHVGSDASGKFQGELKSDAFNRICMLLMTKIIQRIENDSAELSSDVRTLGELRPMMESLAETLGLLQAVA
jgi:hypothetical protein